MFLETRHYSRSYVYDRFRFGMYRAAASEVLNTEPLTEYEYTATPTNCDRERQRLPEAGRRRQWESEKVMTPRSSSLRSDAEGAARNQLSALPGSSTKRPSSMLSPGRAAERHNPSSPQRHVLGRATQRTFAALAG
jgi:hypothetical protein